MSHATSTATTTTTRMMTTTSFISTCADRRLLLCSTTAIMLRRGRLQPRRPRSYAPKKTRSKYPRKDQKDALWWRDYLANAPRAELALHPHGRLAGIFRRDFQELVELARVSWWPTWNDHNVCRAGKPVSHLDLKVLGALYPLANGATQFMVSRHTNLSEEIHRSFFEVVSSHCIDLR